MIPRRKKTATRQEYRYMTTSWRYWGKLSKQTAFQYDEKWWLRFNRMSTTRHSCRKRHKGASLTLIEGGIESVSEDWMPQERGTAKPFRKILAVTVLRDSCTKSKHKRVMCHEDKSWKQFRISSCLQWRHSSVRCCKRAFNAIRDSLGNRDATTMFMPRENEEATRQYKLMAPEG